MQHKGCHISPSIINFAYSNLLLTMTNSTEQPDVPISNPSTFVCLKEHEQDRAPLPKKVSFLDFNFYPVKTYNEDDFLTPIPLNQDALADTKPDSINSAKVQSSPFDFDSASVMDLTFLVDDNDGLVESIIDEDATQVSAESSLQHTDDEQRFKPFHDEKWKLRYKELLTFHRDNGHAAVPHTYPPNPQLARWVKVRITD